MGMLLKNLQKSVSSFRMASSPVLNNLFANKRLDFASDNQRLLLKCSHGSPVDHTYHFAALSEEDFSVRRRLYSPFFEEFRVVAGCSNGLVCLDNTHTDSLLWNPSTGEFGVIPSSRFKSFTFLADMHSFAGGFGYDPKSNDFKIIRFVTYLFDDEVNEVVAEMYSLKSNSWKTIACPGHLVLRRPCTYIDGGDNAYSFWLAYDRDSHFMMSFNYVSEELTSHMLPNVGKPLGGSVDFIYAEFKKNVCVIVFPKLGTEKNFSLWFTNGALWTKEYEFCVPGAERPLGIWGDRHLFFEGMNRQLMVYDMERGKTEVLDIFDYPAEMELIPYVESNVSIKGLMGTNQIQVEEKMML